jgi:glyoxylate reductase
VSKPRVYVTRQIAQEALDSISRVAELEVWPEPLPPPYAIVVERARAADGLLTLLTDRVDAALMEAAPKLRVVSNLAVGYDNIDVVEASRRSIAVGNTPGVLTATTADLAFALLMAAARRVVEADRYTRAGRWQTWGPQTLLGQDLHGATLGIVGLGRIGVELARRARGFEMKILYCDAVRRGEEERRLGVEYVPDLETLLSRADFVSLHVPLLPETRHLVSTAQFAAMKPSAVLVNTSRGPIVDPAALYEALASKQIFAAGIDVTEVEPIPADDRLLTLDNLVITPHIASASFDTRRKMALMAAENLLAGLRGEVPPNCVNPEALSRA